MKKLLTLSAIAMIGLAAFPGCTKKSSSTPGYSMKATVGGTAQSYNNCISSQSAGAVVIEGWSGSSSSTAFPYIWIWLTGYNKTTGTFSFDSTQTANYAEYLSSATTIKLSKSGSVTITSTSPNIVGTFSFTATDGTVISSGSFTAKSY